MSFHSPPLPAQQRPPVPTVTSPALSATHSRQDSESLSHGQAAIVVDHHTDPHSSHELHSIRSCVTCRRRKVRCNKRSPCSNCVKAGIECIFPPPGRAPRKSKRPQDAELLSRLRRLEGVIEHLNEKRTASLSDTPSPGQSRSENVSTQGPPAPHAGPGDGDGCPLMLDAANVDPRRPMPTRNMEHEFGRLVIDEGRSRYVSNRFWASLGDEVSRFLASFMSFMMRYFSGIDRGIRVRSKSFRISSTHQRRRTRITPLQSRRRLTPPTMTASYSDFTRFPIPFAASCHHHRRSRCSGICTTRMWRRWSPSSINLQPSSFLRSPPRTRAA